MNGEGGLIAVVDDTPAFNGRLRLRQDVWVEGSALINMQDIAPQ